MEVTKVVEVGEGGKIELWLPELREGEKVEVRLNTDVAIARRPATFGSMKGEIIIHDNFDDPIPGMEEYM